MLTVASGALHDTVTATETGTAPREAGLLARLQRRRIGLQYKCGSHWHKVIASRMSDVGQGGV